MTGHGRLAHMRKSITVACLAATALAVGAVPSAARESAPAAPVIVGHRTSPSLAPENTVAGIHATATAGARVVEMDVQWSASSFPVLMHDKTVDRTTNGTGTVSAMWLGDLTSLLAQDYAPWKTDPRFANEHVPYGWEFMNAAKVANLDVLLDIKMQPTALMVEKLIHYIDVHNWGARTIIMGNANMINAFRAQFPGRRYALIEYPQAGVIRSGDYVRGLGAEAYAVHYTGVTRAAVDYWHAHGLKVYTWTSDNATQDVAANWDKVRAAGVDAVITNRTDAACAHMPDAC